MTDSSDPRLSRRQVLRGAACAGLAAAFPNAARAQQAASIVAMTFPGTWEQAARSIVVPAFRTATGGQVTVSPVLIVDALARLSAARDNPPYDVVLIDEPGTINARAQDLIEPLPASEIANLANVPDRLKGAEGFGVMAAMQIVGIAYNPQRVRTPPTSWNDLWRPEFRGRVLISGPDTTIGTVWMVAIAKLRGGSETNLEPAWRALDELKPNIATIPPNPGAVGPLFQQGQADIAVSFLSVVEPMRARGVDIAMAKPESGWGLVSNIAHVVKRSRAPRLAAGYVNTLLDAAVQTQLSQAPYYNVPTNRNVPFTGALSAVAPNLDALLAAPAVDWAAIVPQRRDMIDRFNREFRRA